MYITSEQNSPWLRLEVVDRLKIVDSGVEARIYDIEGKIAGRYEGSSFFTGLSRPWMGLHTVDTICRDADFDNNGCVDFNDFGIITSSVYNVW